MKIEEASNNLPNIILVFGKLCSGKGTYCGAHPEYVKIVTSDVVKEITGKTTRSELHKTGHLDKEIATELCRRIQHYLNNNEKVIVDGIRQYSIVQTIINKYDNVEMVWLEVPTDVLKQRFISRRDPKDNQSFEDAYEKDKVLGLGDLEAWLKQHSCAKIIPHLNK